MDFKVGVLREGLATLVTGVLDNLVVHLVLVSVQSVLGGENLLAEPAVKLRGFLVDRLNMSFEGLAVTVVLRERFISITLYSMPVKFYSNDKIPYLHVRGGTVFL